MKLNVLMQLPTCLEHGVMELQKPGTREQEFCGTWYRCTRCTNSVLFTSPALEAQLAQQRAAIVVRSHAAERS